LVKDICSEQKKERNKNDLLHVKFSISLNDIPYHTQGHMAQSSQTPCIGRLLRPDIVHFH
jgi:hypothetical protein